MSDNMEPTTKKCWVNGQDIPILKDQLDKTYKLRQWLQLSIRDCDNIEEYILSNDADPEEILPVLYDYMTDVMREINAENTIDKKISHLLWLLADDQLNKLLFFCYPSHKEDCRHIRRI
jgi:hypothetical protein